MVRLCDRIDIIKVLERTASAYWEGDEHSHGVFVDSFYGYYLNKVFGVRIEHSNHVAPLFYTFQDVGVESKVIDSYPYKNQKKSPKKRELLYKEKELSQESLSEIFEGGEKWFDISKEVMADQAEYLLSTVPNKRERQRLNCEISISDGEMKLSVTRERKNTRLIISEKMSKVSSAQSVTDNPSIRVNANSYYYTLNVAKELEEVTFSLESGKKLLVSGTLRKSDDVASKVIIAVALNKGRI